MYQVTNSYTALSVQFNQLTFYGHPAELITSSYATILLIKDAYHCNYLATLQMFICRLAFFAKLSF